MAGAIIEIKADAENARGLLLDLKKRVDDPTPAMKVIGAIIRTSVVRNFEKQGRPGWKGLSKTTKKLRGASGPILRRQGFAGGLMGSVEFKADSDGVQVGTNKIYGAVHQFGAKKGSFGTIMAKIGTHSRRITQAFGRMIEPRTVTVSEHKRKMSLPWGDIPARPFLMVQDEDWNEIGAALGEFVTGGGR